MISALNWNIRGMKSQAATERLNFLITQYKISFLAIQEPFIKEDKIISFKNKLNMIECFANSSNKIWLFWNSDITCNVFANEDQMVTCKIMDNKAGKEFYISVIYAKSRSSGREDLWRYMRIFATTLNSPWAVCRDFNSILNGDEKLGGLPHRLEKSIPFIEYINDCGLSDMGYSGSKYTWCNERKEQDIIWKRLDRFLANEQWEECFSKTSILHLARYSSDHCPLLINMMTEEVNAIRYFKFLNFWAEQEDFLNIVKEQWEVDITGNIF
ncbi:uncharacterized protein LOC132630739 [Lycium barbarum]|uniref:uncharacterized protein LOC132630739 n=1 Tax=Lycium barbarum TaxID=112863 RepID=UPI00293E4510|nr:uncharacterized protein LOC132630739 [Lycium barbarum]